MQTKPDMFTCYECGKTYKNTLARKLKKEDKKIYCPHCHYKLENSLFIKKK